MKYIMLQNGVQIPLLGFGTCRLLNEEGKQIIINALHTGYRLLDTAIMYRNEDIVGNAIKESGIPRNEIFITTKLDSSCNSYEKAKQGIISSLQKLQTDYVDLLLLHEAYDGYEAMYKAIEEAYLEGKARAIGISNFHEDRFQHFVKHCKIIPMVNQVESHVYFPQLKLQKLMQPYKTQMQSWAPFTQNKRPIFDEPLLKEIGNYHGKTSAQVALRYLVQNGIAVIPKTVHVNRMKENMNIFDFELTPSQMQQIQSLDEHQSLFGWVI